MKSANAAFYETFQVTPDATEGKPLVELGNRQWDIPELQQRLSRVLPESSEFTDFEMEHEFERIGRRTMLLHARALGGAQLILLGMVDLTERKRGEHERELLSRELSHRVRNILAVVQALATQTDHSRTVEEFRETLVGRLSALARAQPGPRRRLARRRSQGVGGAGAPGLPVDHPELVEIEGESMPLSPSQGLGLSLILHELGTNAAKYGALSQSEGRARVSWQVVEDGKQGRRIRLRWEERGGPQVEPPTEKSFGTRLIERACTSELEGEVELDYPPLGYNAR